MKAFIVCLTVTFIIFMTVIVNAEPLTFREFILGASKTEVLNLLPDQDNCMNNFCSANFKIKDITVNAIFFFDNDILDHIYFSFSPDHFETLKDAMIEKYGKSFKNYKTKIQNRMGAVFQNDQYIWDMKNGRVAISKYGTTIDEGAAVISSIESVKKFETKEKERKNKPGF